MHYDVVVIGAGPGGCMSARILTDAGFKVLLVERGKIPREKPCGGFLPPDGIRRIEEHFGPIPPHCRAESSIVRGGRLICQGGGRYDLPFPEPGLSVLRSRLDAFLTEGCGAEVMDASEVEDFRAGRFLVQTSIRTEEDVARAKPDPELFLATLAALNVAPEEAIVLEDSPNGLRAAKRAGLFCLVVPNPITRQLDLEGADLRVDSLADLPLEQLLARAGEREVA